MMLRGLRIGERARRAYNWARMLSIQPRAIAYADKSNARLQITQDFVHNLASPEASNYNWMETSCIREDVLNTLFASLLSAYAHRRRRQDTVDGLVVQFEEAGGAHSLGTPSSYLMFIVAQTPVSRSRTLAAYI